MRVLILNQFFYPDLSATSQLMTDLAEDLVARGVEVTALCCQSAYVGGGKFSSTEDYKSIRIERVKVTRFSRDSMARRLSSYLSFYVNSFFRILRLPRHDVILVLTTPPLIAIVAYIARFFKGSKMVCLVQDLYPDIAIRLEVLKSNRVFTKLLEKISVFLFVRADAVIVLGGCMRERLVEKGIPSEKIHLIQNWADGEMLKPVDKLNNPFVREHGLANKFVVLYSGNMGSAHDFGTIIEAIRLLTEEKEVVFLFIGDGKKKEELLRFVNESKCENVMVLDYVPREQLTFSLGAADLSLISMAAGLEGLMVPSKLYGIMASGRPSLYVGPAGGEVARTIRDANCGFVIENGAAELLRDAILTARSSPKLVQEMGVRAREALQEKYDRKIATKRYWELFTTLLTPNKKGHLPGQESIATATDK